MQTNYKTGNGYLLTLDVSSGWTVKTSEEALFTTVLYSMLFRFGVSSRCTRKAKLNNIKCKQYQTVQVAFHHGNNKIIEKFQVWQDKNTNCKQGKALQ